MLDFRNLDSRKLLLRTLRSPHEILDFGYVPYDHRRDFLAFLLANGIVRAIPEHETHYWWDNEKKPKYIIDINFPVYMAKIPFIMSNALDPKERCTWREDELLLLDHDLKFWWADDRDDEDGA